MSIVLFMRDRTGDVTPEDLRHHLHCKALAGERYRDALARMLKITDTEATALAHLARHGQLTPGELGVLVGLTSGGTTALIHRLEAAGHLSRHPHPADRRSMLLTASPSIVTQAEELYAPLVKAMDEVSERLTEEERVVVGRYLSEIAAVSEQHAERLQAAVRADSTEVVAAPAPGLWA
jgi:DNA-binding MarR family transcriptional regulator